MSQGSQVLPLTHHHHCRPSQVTWRCWWSFWKASWEPWFLSGSSSSACLATSSYRNKSWPEMTQEISEYFEEIMIDLKNILILTGGGSLRVQKGFNPVLLQASKLSFSGDLVMSLMSFSSSSI